MVAFGRRPGGSWAWAVSECRESPAAMMSDEDVGVLMGGVNSRCRDGAVDPAVLKESLQSVWRQMTCWRIPEIRAAPPRGSMSETAAPREISAVAIIAQFIDEGVYSLPQWYDLVGDWPQVAHRYCFSKAECTPSPNQKQERQGQKWQSLRETSGFIWSIPVGGGRNVNWAKRVAWVNPEQN